MALEITGKVFTVLPSQNGQGQKGPWVKQNFVIETGDQYPKKVCLLAWNDKAEIVSRLKEGDEVKQNEEFGFIRFGSRVDVFFPVGTKLDVKIGDIVQVLEDWENTN